MGFSHAYGEPTEKSEDIGAKDIALSEKELCEIDKLLDKTEIPVYGQNAKR